MDPIDNLPVRDNRMVSVSVMTDDMHFIAQVMNLATNAGILTPSDRARACAVAGGFSRWADLVDAAG